MCVGKFAATQEGEERKREETEDATVEWVERLELR